MTIAAVLARLASASMVAFLLVHAWALLGVLWHYDRARRHRGALFGLAGLWRHLMPPEILRSRWTRLDVAVYALHPLLQLALFQFVLGLTVLAAGLLAAGLTRLAAPGWLPGTWWVAAPFLLGGLLARDFASFYVHYLQHKFPLLWRFHKVHHAPETLVPFTTRRLHPLDELLGLVADAVFLGAVVGVQGWAMGLRLPGLVDDAATLYVLANALTFSPLRHSHIDLRLGPMERLLLSPAHHQMHHSVEREHWDRNFGAMLPVWDRLWGTLLEPQPPGSFRLGLPDGESERYVRLRDVYLEPLRFGRQTQAREGEAPQGRSRGPCPLAAPGQSPGLAE